MSTLTAGRPLVRIGISNREYNADVGTHLFFQPAGWREHAPMRTANGRWYVNGPLIVCISAQEEADGNPWLHLSVSVRDRYPTYRELLTVRRDFIPPKLKAVHIWPPEEEHVNRHPFCIHMFARLNGDSLPDFRRWNEDAQRWEI